MLRLSSLTLVIVSTAICMWWLTPAKADSFGRGANYMSIDFVTISSDASAANGTNISQHESGHSNYKTFTAPSGPYRIGVYEISEGQWSKFKNSLGVPVTGNPTSGYDYSSYLADPNDAAGYTSFYEAAQFVNWLNTSTNHHPAYNFTGTQGTSSYSLSVWSAAEADSAVNRYRHKDALYYLPTEFEWVQAAYWNGTSLQTDATRPGDTLHQGDGSPGAGWNYYNGSSYATSPFGAWSGSSGAEELNGTRNMMGNVWEWTEGEGMSAGSYRAVRGGSFYHWDPTALYSNNRSVYVPYSEPFDLGFRVASDLYAPFSSGTQITVTVGDSSGHWGEDQTGVQVEFTGIDSASHGPLDFTAEIREVTGDQLAALQAAMSGTPGVQTNWSFSLSRDLAGAESTDLVFDLGRTDLVPEDVQLWHYNGSVYEEITTGLDFSMLDEGIVIATGITEFSDYTVTVPIPEPATLSLLALAGWLAPRRRRR